MKIIDKYAVSENAPQDTTVGWYDPVSKELKLFTSTGWEPVVATPPVASADALGGVKVGEGLSVTEDGNLSVAGAKLLIAHFAYNSSEDKIVLSLDADGERVYEQEASSTDGGFIPLYTAAEHGAPVTMAVAAKWVLTHPFITFDQEGHSIPIILVPVSNNVNIYMPDGDAIKNMGGQFSFYTSDDVYFYANLDIRQNNFGLYVYHDS